MIWLLGAEDSEIFEKAREADAVVVTKDIHFVETKERRGAVLRRSARGCLASRSRQLIDFDQISGPKASKSANFAQLLGEVLAREYNTFSLDGAGGDKGIDAYTKDISGSLTIFQFKYFRGRIDPSRRAQISHSFKAAHTGHKMARWILCTPVDPTFKELRWLESLPGNDHILVEWWGETRLRSLISRHTDLMATFFTEHKILEELRQIRRDLCHYQAIVTDRPTHQHESVAANAYLRQASRILGVLAEDNSLVDRPQESIIAVDFNELYAYMARNPVFTLSGGAASYCIESSVASLTLPPGAAFELAQFTKSLAKRGLMEAYLASGTESQLRLFRDNFVKEYDADPQSTAAGTAYRLLLAELPSSARYAPNAINRIVELLETGRLNVWTGPDLLDGNFFRKTLGWLEERTGRRRSSNLADAMNLCTIKLVSSTRSEPIRLLSSGRLVYAAALELLDRPVLVRTMREYAFFLRLYQSIGSARDNVALYAEKVSQIQREVIGMLESLPEVSDILERQVPLKRETLKILTLFIGTYREWLQPLDQMVESDFKSIREPSRVEMSELYQALTSQAGLSSAFRTWLERVCAAAAELEALVTQRYDVERLLAWLEERQRLLPSG